MYEIDERTFLKNMGMSEVEVQEIFYSRELYMFNSKKALDVATLHIQLACITAQIYAIDCRMPPPPPWIVFESGGVVRREPVRVGENGHCLIVPRKT
jgi:hypothetical protein